MGRLASTGPDSTSPGSHTVYALFKAHRVLLAKNAASFGMIGIRRKNFGLRRQTLDLGRYAVG